MKKKIQQDLTDLTHRLNQLGKGSSAGELKELCRKIYERLSILEYLEEQLNEDGSQPETVSFDSKSFREQNWFVEPEPVPRPEHQEDLVEPLMEKIKDIVAQMPGEGQRIDALLESVLPSHKTGLQDFEKIAAEYKQIPVFERKTAQEEPQKASRINEASTTRSKSLNERVGSGIKIGLNDRLAFVKKLFEGSNEDYNRVLSQIMTMNSMSEVSAFIETKVKPDYNWEHQQDLEARFIGLIKRSFN